MSGTGHEELDAMKRLLVPLSLLLLALTGTTARAQLGHPPVTPFTQPVVSPFVNLGLRGVNPGISYFGIVRPQLEAQANIQQLTQFATAQTYLDNTALLAQPILNTGTGSGFMTANRYFQTVGRPGSATGTGGTTAFATPGFNNFVLPGQNLGVRLR
jgi:hypothetical protein